MSMCIAFVLWSFTLVVLDYEVEVFALNILRFARSQNEKVTPKSALERPQNDPNDGIRQAPLGGLTLGLSGGLFAGSFWASRGRFKAKMGNPSPRTESASE